MQLWSIISRKWRERTERKRKAQVAQALGAMSPELRQELFRHAEFLRSQGVSVRELARGEEPSEIPEIGEKPL